MNAEVESIEPSGRAGGEGLRITPSRRKISAPVGRLAGSRASSDKQRAGRPEQVDMMSSRLLWLLVALWDQIGTSAGSPLRSVQFPQ